MTQKQTYCLVPLTELTSAMKPGPLQVYPGYWWMITPEGQAVFFGKDQRHPMANLNKSIVEKMLNSAPEGSQVEFVSWAYVKFDIIDYS